VKGRHECRPEEAPDNSVVMWHLASQSLLLSSLFIFYFSVFHFLVTSSFHPLLFLSFLLSFALTLLHSAARPHLSQSTTVCLQRSSLLSSTGNFQQHIVVVFLPPLNPRETSHLSPSISIAFLITQLNDDERHGL
jgi:hypothetical protein